MSQIASFDLIGADGAKLAAYRSLPQGPPRGVVQIAHGISEHFGRYARVTKALTDAGYAVFGQDHRGHGRSASAHGEGEFGPNGFQALVDDMYALTEVARKRYPGKPLILLAHSMGSFASQIYLSQHPRALDALVLSGAAAMDKLLESLMASGRPVTLELLNENFEPARTSFDWISRDEAEVDAYIADPLRFTASDAAMGSMFALGSQARFDPRLSDVSADLPVYVISGEVDPVVGPGQIFTQALIESLQGAGLRRIEHRVYPGGRHEMFNELNRREVESDLIGWLDRTLATFSVGSRAPSSVS
jgi:alpha-beta hydrolase superfamily lysophospholipase